MKQRGAGAVVEFYQHASRRRGRSLARTPEQMELLLSGLVEKQQGFLKVKNPIYQKVFDCSWVEGQLASLRPYSQALNAWIATQQTDDSRLLRGQALKDAHTVSLPERGVDQQ